MPDNDARMLAEGILDYLQWIKSSEEHKGSSSVRYSKILIDFLIYSIRKDIDWDDMFTFDILKAFRKETNLKNIPHTDKG